MDVEGNGGNDGRWIGVETSLNGCVVWFDFFEVGNNILVGNTCVPSCRLFTAEPVLCDTDFGRSRGAYRGGLGTGRDDAGCGRNSLYLNSLFPWLRDI